MSNFLDALLGSGTATALATTGLPVAIDDALPPVPGQALIALDGGHAAWQEIVATGVDVVAGAGMTKLGATLNVGAPPDGSIVVGADDVRVGVLGSARVLTALAGQRIGALLDPTLPQDAATRAWVEQLVATVLGELGGGGDGVTPAAVLAALAAVLADVSVNAQRIVNVAAPVDPTDAATRDFVETAAAAATVAGNGLSKTGAVLAAVAADASIVVSGSGIALGTIPSAKMTGLPSAAVGATDATSKAYTDAQRDAAVATAAAALAALALTDTQHGARAGGALHANVVAAGAAGFMSGADKTKLDGVATGATVAPALASTTPAAVGTAAIGVGTTTARADHVHAHGTQLGGTLHADVIAAGASGFMSGTDKTKLDGVATGATVAPALANTAPPDVGSAAASGIGTTTSRADHVHAHGNQLGGALHANVVAAGAAGFMTGSDKTKLDGVATGATVAPALASTTPAAVGTAAIGVGTTTARADHVHAHGNQLGGTLHADVIAAGASGFMSGTDKTKLDNLGTHIVADHVFVSSITLSGIGQVSGEGTVTAAQLVLVTAQSPSSANGLYTSAAGAWTRSTLADTTAKVNALPLVVSQSGVVYTLLARGFLTLGSSSLDFRGATWSTVALETGSTPNSVGVTGVMGASTYAARSDHVHPHGTFATAATLYHALAVAGGNPGFLAGADKTKIDKLDVLAASGTALQVGQVTVDAVHDAPVALTLSSGAATHNSQASNRAQLTLSANATLTLSNLANGRRGIIAVRQDATGSRTLAFTTTGWTQLRDASFGDLAPSAAASSVTLYTYACEVLGGTQYIIFGKLMAA
jgi:hypothetical protein